MNSKFILPLLVFIVMLNGCGLSSTAPAPSTSQTSSTTELTKSPQASPPEPKTQQSPLDVVKNFIKAMNEKDYYTAAGFYSVTTDLDRKKLANFLFIDYGDTRQFVEIEKIIDETIEGNYALYHIGVKASFPNNVGYLPRIEYFLLHYDNGHWFIADLNKDEALKRKYLDMYKSKNDQLESLWKEYYAERKHIRDKFHKDNPNYPEELQRDREARVKKYHEVEEQLGIQNKLMDG